MAKKKKDGETAEAEPLPTHLEQGEAADTDARLHGDDSLPAEPPVVDGTEPDEAQLPLNGEAQPNGEVLVRVTARGIPETRMRKFIESLRSQGIDAEVVEEEPDDHGFASAVNQCRARHEGAEETLRKYAHTVDGTEFIGMRGITLAEALEANDRSLKAKLAGLYGTREPHADTEAQPV